MSRPLVLVTRAALEGTETADRLLALGYRPILEPMLEFFNRITTSCL